jgi:hypothetical protein
MLIRISFPLAVSLSYTRKSETSETEDYQMNTLKHRVRGPLEHYARMVEYQFIAALHKIWS